MARLPYLDHAQLPPEHQDYFESLRTPEGHMMNLHRMMAHRPSLLQARVNFSRTLNRKDPTLPPRYRELAQLTVGRITACAYEYHHHVSRGQKAGLSAEHIMSLPVWETHPLFTREERAVIRYAEEMTRDIRVQDGTFDALRGFLSPAQIVELTLVVAHYNSTVHFLEALQVRLGEDGGE